MGARSLLPGRDSGPGEYLDLEEEPTFLLKLAERVKATSISGTSTMTCGLCTKPRPLCAPTHRRRSVISRALLSSGPSPWEEHRSGSKSLGGRGEGAHGKAPGGGVGREESRGQLQAFAGHTVLSGRAPAKSRHVSQWELAGRGHFLGSMGLSHSVTSSNAPPMPSPNSCRSQG